MLVANLCTYLMDRSAKDRQSGVLSSQVAVALDGTLYVGDGYCNSRVVEFSAEGEWRGEFVLPGEALRNPHSVVLQECSRALYVAEREASRVHRFSLDTRQLEGVPLAGTSPPFCSDKAAEDSTKAAAFFSFLFPCPAP